jgi:hypothetical protein
MTSTCAEGTCRRSLQAVRLTERLATTLLDLGQNEWDGEPNTTDR